MQDIYINVWWKKIFFRHKSLENINIEWKILATSTVFKKQTIKYRQQN